MKICYAAHSTLLTNQHFVEYFDNYIKIELFGAKTTSAYKSTFYWLILKEIKDNFVNHFEYQPCGKVWTEPF